jgi:hypothetical protein
MCSWGYLISAACNLVVAALLGISAWCFLACQRAARLRDQLDRLANIVRGDNEGEIEQLYKTETERQQQWHAALESIKDDVEKIPDRLVRLNAATQLRLASMFNDINDNLGPELAKILDGKGSGNHMERKAMQNVEALRDSISIWNYLEKPWQNFSRRRR